MSDKLTVGCVQLTSTTDIAENIKNSSDLIREAHGLGQVVGQCSLPLLDLLGQLWRLRHILAIFWLGRDHFEIIIKYTCWKKSVVKVENDHRLGGMRESYIAAPASGGPGGLTIIVCHDARDPLFFTLCATSR
jgi:hypothetical protein